MYSWVKQIVYERSASLEPSCTHKFQGNVGNVNTNYSYIINDIVHNHSDILTWDLWWKSLWMA